MKVRSRFDHFRDRTQVFLLGFLLGIVLGGGFFVLKIDQYVKELNFYKSLTQKDDTDDKNVKSDDTVPGKPRTHRTKKENVRTDTAEKAQALQTSGDSVPPSVFSDDDDNIVVKKDELLGQKPFGVIDLKEVKDDSTASVTPGKSVTVEFWKSPLNYRGYKFSRNRLVLFGFETEDVESVYSLDNAIYVKSVTGVFRVDPTTDFRQMERVTDESLIARMK
ncbi:MAG TPA: hypothetical protein VFU15_12265 [Bacteroidia bacterium]|nr:hypothetical protein [Bacteroidia bacterium]